MAVAVVVMESWRGNELMTVAIVISAVAVEGESEMSCRGRKQDDLPRRKAR